MSEKQAKLKKATNIVFLVVTAVVAGWFLYNGIINNQDFFSGSKISKFCLSIITVLSTVLYFLHIRFKRSILFGIANLIVLFFLLFFTENKDSLFFNMIWVTIYAALSSIYFFSYKIIRKFFPNCPTALSLLNLFYSMVTISGEEWGSYIIVTSFMILAYILCELLAYYFSSPWYCENCGNKNGDKHFFCTKCGGKNPYLK